jgi:hypothetical protein
MERRAALRAIDTIMVICLLAATCVGDEVFANGQSDSDEPVTLLLSPADARPVPADYDGDGSADMALKGSNGVWYIDMGANGFGGRWDSAYVGYGGVTAVPVPADYDHDFSADLSVKGANGMWGIDYAANGFGVWDFVDLGYGGSSAIPVPADYDNDGAADLAVKTSTGDWFINYSADGFVSGWNAQFTGYGNSSAIPVPADYDGDHHADLAVKASDGCWYIDYWSGGFGAWNEIRCGYGNASAVPVPADYDNDGRADLSVKDNSGNWYVDLAVDGFGAWNLIYSGYGSNSALAVPADYDDDGALDLSTYSTVTGDWYIDYAANGLSGWDAIVANAPRIVIDTTRPYITSTTIYGEGNVPVSELTVGVRYVVDVVVHRGTGSDNRMGVEINEALNVPESMQLVNRFGSTYIDDFVDRHGSFTETHRRYALTPKQPGNFPLGFQLRTAPPYYADNQIYNPDYGIRVGCVSPPQTALSGVVTQRIQNAQGVFVSGPPIEGATVELVSSGGITTTTDWQGKWHFPVAGAGPPMSVRITQTGYSEMNVVNLTVPVSGLLVNSALERSFPQLPSGIQYRSYLDYSRGRTLLHVVEITPASGNVRIEKAPFDLGSCAPGCSPQPQCPHFDTLEHVGESRNDLVIMNATWWNLCNGDAVGYVYALDYQASERYCDDSGEETDCSHYNVYYVEGGGNTPLYPVGTCPMFTIKGHNQFDIVESRMNFLEVPSPQWSQIGNPPHPIWDVAPRDGQSDVTYAIQIPNPALLRNGAVIAAGHFVNDSAGNYDYAFARTSVGVGPTGKLYLVVADGEGVHGGNGATGNQLGHFYRDVLGASTAMGLDSGLSTELMITTSNGLHRVNTLTGEDAGIQANPYTEVLPTADGAIGAVGYYLAVSGDLTDAPVSTNAAVFALNVRSSIGSSLFQFDLSLPQAGAADLKLYDVRGRQVAVAFRGELESGFHRIIWRGTDDHGAKLSAGVYFYRLTTRSGRATGSVVLLK